MTLRIGTCANKLALSQTNDIAGRLRAAHPEIEIAIVEGATADDAGRGAALEEGGDGSRSAIQQALRAGEVDIAVHSFADLPTKRPEGLVIAAVPVRDDPRDALVSRSGAKLIDLPQGSVIATSSSRRAVQVRAIRPDLDIRLTCGNVESHLRKLDNGEYDAVVLALADLRRLGLEGRVTQAFGLYDIVPAPAQGALAVECRGDDHDTRRLLAAIDDAQVRQAVTAERSFLAEIDAGCDFPAAAFAEIFGTTLKLHALLSPGGQVTRAKITGPVDAGGGLGWQLAQEMMARLGMR
ncbi:MAG: hydroxymethylbilane synthase [Dehalococcoidia bacterium]|nr:hydroxymethylbilane synthase [Dehalococcoidia bacterium]